MRKRLSWMPVLFMILLALLTTISCSGNTDVFSSNGERIYFTSKNASGDAVHSSGFSLFSRKTCASCHGADGKGNPKTDVPDVTWQALTSMQAGIRQPRPWFGTPVYAHGAEEHVPYTEETLKKALTEGVMPDGKELNKRMPRWQMTSQDLDDLVAFLKSL